MSPHLCVFSALQAEKRLVAGTDLPFRYFLLMNRKKTMRYKRELYGNEIGPV